MKRILTITIGLALCVVILSSCGISNIIDNITPGISENGNTESSGENKGNSGTEVSAGEVAEVDFSKTEADMFTDRDSETDYDESKAILIELNGNSAKASDNSVKISGSTVTITEDATHIISGSLDNGMIIVDAPDTAKLQIILNNVTVTSETSAALYVKEADKVFVTVVGENLLGNGGSFTAIDDSNIDGAIFSKQDITFNGSGSLDVNSPAGQGIVGKDDVVFTSGTYNIATSSHAISANDSVRVKNAKITADAGKDGIHCENTEDNTKGFVFISSGSFDIECEGDGISAGSYLQIEDGTIDILAGGGYENGTKESSGGWGDFGGGFGGGGRPSGRPGGQSSGSSTSSTDSDSSSMKGLKSGNSMLISKGEIKIDSADDAIHSDISATINGGTFEIASGDDALHTEENLTVTNGKFNITHSYEGLEAQCIKVSGGDIKLKATDDGLNAAGGTDSSGYGGRDNMFGGGGFGGWGGNSNGSIVISGGNLYINSSGDAIDANGTLEITGGYTVTTGPTSGDTTVLDFDKTGTISGGTFIGTGSSMMVQSITGSGQGVIAFSAGNQSVGTEIVIKDKDGNIIVSHEPELEYEIVIISTPDIKSGETYYVTVGSQSAEFEAK